MNNYEKLCNVLKTNSALTTDNGDLLKNKVQELARKMDASLLATLLSNSFTEEMFFADVDGVKIFDVNKFTYMVESQAFLPDSYTRFKQNILLTDGTRPISKSGDVVLEFPNKDCILEFDSTDTNADRNEVFLNETLMKKEIDTLFEHKAFSNATKYTVNGPEPTTEVSMQDNLIIKGNNLLTLHTLYPKYKGQIKLMYWDILYNTDNDKVPYNDSFKHSSWLTMMKNRLEIAKKLLKQDGIICIQCDKNEDAYLKVLCDEIFDRENFVNSITVRTSTPSGTKTTWRNKTIIKTKDTLLVYAKNNNYISIKPQYVPKTNWDKHYSFYLQKENNGNYKVISLKDKMIEDGIYNEKITKESARNSTYLNYFIDNKNHIFRTAPTMPADIKKKSKENKDVVMEYFDANGNKQYAYNGNRIVFLSESIKQIDGKDVLAQLLCDIWTDIDFQNTQNEGGKNISLPSGQKPEALIRRIIEMFTEKNDIVLDAYLGSGTTAAVAHKMDRRYIGIEQLDSHSIMEIERMKGVLDGEQSGISKVVNWTGGGSFVYFELAKNSQNIIDKITVSNDINELNNIYDELKSSPFVLYTTDIHKMEKEKNLFNELTIDEQKNFLISIIDKNTLYINYSDIEDESCPLSDADKDFTRNFYEED